MKGDNVKCTSFVITACLLALNCAVRGNNTVSGPYVKNNCGARRPRLCSEFVFLDSGERAEFVVTCQMVLSILGTEYHMYLCVCTYVALQPTKKLSCMSVSSDESFGRFVGSHADCKFAMVIIACS